MSRLSGYIALFITLTIAAGLLSACSGDNASDLGDFSVSYTAEQELIFEKTAALAALKAKAVTAKARLGISDDSEYIFQEYEDIIDEIKALKAELIGLGAEPDAETFGLIMADTPFSTGGGADPAEDPESAFSGAFDVGGVPYSVETSYGTFNTYQIIIQGRERVDGLAAFVYQNKVLGYDLYAKNSGVVSEMPGLIGDIQFEKAAFLTVKSRPETEVISKEAELFEALKSLDDTMTADKSVSDKRLGQSYRIYCSAVPTVTFVCVQDHATKVWRHTLTINSVAINETHQFYMSFAKGRGSVSHVSGEKDFSRVIDHPGSARRLYDAVAAYHGGKPICDNVIKSYVFGVKNGSDVKKAVRLEIPAPLDFNELIRYCQKTK